MKIISAKVAEQELASVISKKCQWAVQSFNDAVLGAIAKGKNTFNLDGEIYSIISEEIKEAGYTITSPKSGYDPYFEIEF